MIRIADWTFGSPFWLFASILVIPIGILLFRYELGRRGVWKITHFSSHELKAHNKRIRILRIIFYLIGILGLLSIFLAMARPHSLHFEHQQGLQYNEGIDIILTIDISQSMLERDFSPNRIEVAKKVAKEFVQGRKFDRIGLVVYAGEAMTLCPPTSDYNVLIKKIENISTKIAIEDGTAIGVGLGTAVTRLREDSKGAKVIILLTDGSNNAGNLSPLDAAQIAKAKKVRVYTIGMGKRVKITGNPEPNKNDKLLDETTLRQIASRTEGQYFHVENEKVLTEVYKQINSLEKKKIEEVEDKKYARATPAPFIWAAIILTSLFWLLNNTLFHTNE